VSAVRSGRLGAERGALTAAAVAGLFSAALAAAASRPWGLGPLGLCCYVPAFVVILRSRRPLSGAVTAGLASLGVVSVGYEATVGIFPGVYALALVVASLPFAAAGALAVRFLNSSFVSRLTVAYRPAVSMFALACLWALAELLPASADLFGVWALPLSVIGYSQIDLPTAQLAAFSSVTAVSAFVLLINASLAASWIVLAAVSTGSTVQRRAPRLRRELLAVVLTVVLTVLAPAIGLTALLTAPLAVGAPGPDEGGFTPKAGSALNIRLVQPNLPDSVYVAAGVLPSVREWLVADLVAVAAAGPTAASTSTTLTLLPEAAWPSVIEPSEAAALYNAVHDLGPMLIGAATNGWTDPDLDGPDGATIAAGHAGSTGSAADGLTNRPRTANSVLGSDAGGITHLYDKRRLVPIAESRLQPGAGPVVVAIAGLKVAPLICYDVVFAADARAAARAGAELLAVHTDDSFAARADVPRLHLRVARMRAIETGLPVALVSNTGPSAVIAADGNLIATTSPLEATTLTAALPGGSGTTPYVRFGDWVGGAITAIGLGVGALSVAGGGAPRA